MRRTLVAVIVCAFMAPTAAHAAPTPTPEVVNPLPVPRITIETNGNGYGIRKFAREVETQVPGLRIHERGVCARRPNTVCVRVLSEHYGDTGWYAAAYGSHPLERNILVNLDAPHPDPYALMAHEFGHVLGMDHHQGEGVVGSTPNVKHLSEAELAALRAAYPVEGERVL